MQSILQNEHGTNHDLKAYYEKKIDYGKVIADCLLIDTKRIIGIELKSASDNLTRLRKQLKSYLNVCNLVYVYVSDKHVKNVQELLSKSPFKSVGIISYEVFNGEIITGLVKPATNNHNFNIQNLMNSMLAKDTLKQVLRTYVQHNTSVYANTLGKPHYGTDEIKHSVRTRTLEETSKYTRFNAFAYSKATKPQLIKALNSLMTPLQLLHITCDILRNPKYVASKNLVVYDTYGNYVKGSRAWEAGDIWYDARGRKHIVRR